ncbi:MAG: ECF RNA polymerase sigma factor SigW [Chloroflexi bacterium ADurb.Bin180]|nr:MAG: ECF RNA polymerase sigma factor SigW [Chloroflexi bacterium ADurb.Bin180]
MADDAALLDRIRQYDQAALAQVYDAYYERIYRYVYRFVGQVDASEDLTANVFLRLLDSLRGGNCPRTNLLAWLYRVAHNLVVDTFRRGASQEVELADWLEGYEPDLAHMAEQSIKLERVRRALLELTPAQQQVIMLKFVEGMDSSEVAAIMVKTEGAVDALQHRALTALRDALRESSDTSGGATGDARGQVQTKLSPDADHEQALLSRHGILWRLLQRLETTWATGGYLIVTGEAWQ